MNANQVSTASTAELLAFFNANTGGAQVKKFADRKTAERRVLALIEEMIADGDLQPQEETKVTKEVKKPFDYQVDGCPKCHTIHDQTCAGEDGTIAGDERNFCHHCGTEYWRETGEIYKAPSKSATRSAAIAKSWENDAIASARAARDNVVVEGYGTFRSVAAAFKKIGLPISRHIKFRIDLKANGTGTFKYGTDEYSFKVVKQEELGL